MKRILLLILFTGSLFAQRQDTIFQVVFNATQTLGESAAITNIGQPYHILTMSVADAPSKTCSAWGAGGLGGRVELEGSFDNITYIRIGQPVSTLLKGTPSLVWGYGAFPYLKVNYIDGDTTNCTLTVTYSGSLYGTKITPVYDSNVKNGFVSTTFLSTGAGDITVGPCGNYTKNVSVYGFYINNTTAGTLTGNVIKTVSSTAATIDSMNLGSIAALGSVWMKAESVPILGANQGTAAFLAVPPVNVVITTSAAGLTGWVLYRCE